MSAFFRLVFLLFVVLGATTQFYSEDLPPFGSLPRLEKEWALHDTGNRGGTSWRVFQNSKTSDLLSFFARTLGAQEKRDLIYCSDSACEIFAARGERPPEKSTEQYMISPLLSKVTSLGLVDSARHANLSCAVLKYAWVGEPENGGASWMAQGFVMNFDGVRLFVQHTSGRPISGEFVENVATELILLHAKQNAPR